MILERIRLHNYCQHQDLDLKIEGTLIALTGPNGKGKSNLLGGIQFGLTGEHPGKNKDELLRWGADSGYVTIEFSHEQVKAQITRALHNSTVELNWGTEKIRGITQVNEALRTRLGMDKDLVRQAVFVRQAEIDSILFTGARERELAFQRLLGIGDATKIHKVLGDVISELGLPVNYDEQIAQGKQRQQELAGRLAALNDQLQKIQGARRAAPSEETLRDSLTTAQAGLTGALRVTRAVNALEEQDNRTNQARKALDDIPMVVLDLPATDAAIQDLQSRIHRANQFIQARGAWQTCGEALMALGNSPYAPEDLQEAKRQYDEVTAEINRLAGRHKLHQDMLNGLKGAQGLQECPVCGSKVEDIQRLNDRLQGILQGIQQEGTALRGTQQGHQKVMTTIDQALRTFNAEYGRRTAAYQQADSTLRATPESHEDPTQLSSEQSILKADRQRFLATMTQRQSLEATWQTHRGTLERCHREYQQAIEAIKLLIPTAQPQDIVGLIQTLQGQIPQLEQQRDQLHQLDTEIAKLSGMVGELGGAAQELVRTIQALEAKRAGQAGTQEALAMLGRVRDWFS